MCSASQQLEFSSFRMLQLENYFRNDAWQSVAAEICRRNGISHHEMRRSDLGENIVFLVDQNFVIKIFALFPGRHYREVSALTIASDRLPIKLPSLICNGVINGWPYIVTTHLRGRPFYDSWDSVATEDQIEIMSGLGVAMRQLHSLEVGLIEMKSFCGLGWRAFIQAQLRLLFDQGRVKDKNQRCFHSLPKYLESNLSALPRDNKQVLLHGDLNPGNFLVEIENGRRKISGLIDFADSLSGFHEYDFVTPVMQMASGNRKLQRALLLAYGYKKEELTPLLRRRLMLLTILHEGSIWEEAVQRLGPNANDLNLEALEEQIWNFV
jgi:fructosamine-3-kinase